MENTNIVNTEMDIDWFAIDKDGHIGYFTSAGFGNPIPVVIAKDKCKLDTMYKYFKSLAKISSCRITFNPGGILKDWMEMSETGLFAYDFQTQYVQISSPQDPLMVFSLNSDIVEMVSSVTFNSFCFKDLISLSPKDIVNVLWY